MKKISTFFILIMIWANVYTQTAGVWHGGLTINLNSVFTTYRIPNGIGPGANFSGANLGNITASSTVQITFGRLASFKNGTCDVTDGRMYYRIYRQGTTIPSYSTLEFGFGCDCFSNNFGCVSGGMSCNTNDQIWHETSASVDLLALAMNNDGAPGTYNLDIYFEINVQGGGCNNTPTATSLVYTATFTATSSLPVELVHFKAEKAGKFIQLHWATASETNNAYFDLQRSPDSRNWQTIGTVPGNGTSYETKEYSYTDRQPLPGTNYYRLKQVDLDGRFEYSKVVFVDFKTDGKQTSISPNPASDVLFFSLPLEESGERFLAKVYDMSGKLWQHTMVTDQIMDISGLPSGVYFVQVLDENNGLLLRERFVKD